MSGLHEGGFEQIIGFEGAELGLGRFYIANPVLEATRPSHRSQPDNATMRRHSQGSGAFV
jgi:hypothetical protein